MKAKVPTAPDILPQATALRARVSRSRGHKVLATERPIREGTPVERLTEEDVLEFLLAEIVPFVVR